MKAGWEETTLGNIVTLNYGKALAKSERNPSGVVPVYGANGVMDWSDHFLTEGPSLVIGRKGTAGAVTAVDGPFWPADVTYYTTHDSSRVDFHFLHYALSMLDLPSLARGVKPGINRNDVYALTLPLPPVEEQKRIVAILDEAFEGLERAKKNAEANLANMRDLFENQLERTLADTRLRLNTSLGEHINLLSGHAFKSKQYTSDPNGMRLLRGDNIVPGGIRWEGVKRWPLSNTEPFERYHLSIGDILIAMDRTWIKAGIKFAVVRADDVPSLLVQRVARLRCRDSLSPEYLALLLESKMFERYVLGIQTGTGVPHISAGQIKDFQFPLPTIDAQHDLARQLHTLRSRVASAVSNYAETSIELANLRQSILAKAFAGELT